MLADCSNTVRKTSFVHLSSCRADTTSWKGLWSEESFGVKKIKGKETPGHFCGEITVFILPLCHVGISKTSCEILNSCVFVSMYPAPFPGLCVFEFSARFKMVPPSEEQCLTKLATVFLKGITLLMF